MNRLLSMRQVRDLLGMEGRSNRLVLRRLKAIAAERGGAFQLQKVGKGWHTTRDDVRQILPELFAHEAAEADSLRELVGELRRKVATLENIVFRLQQGRAGA